jgi:ATP-dependent DNA helicase DinG
VVVFLDIFCYTWGMLDGAAIQKALLPGGVVAKRLPNYEIRDSQLELMSLIVDAFNNDGLAALEAGTGVGKSFAYLLPAIRFAHDTKERIVVSTATITLQQQLFSKDIPLVLQALGYNLKAVLVKGRGNYLCRRRLKEQVEDEGLNEDVQQDVAMVAERAGQGRPADVQPLQFIVDWAKTTETGAKQDCGYQNINAIWGQVCSEADLCLGMQCPFHLECFVMKLRKECAEAKILVVNHHLLFADLAARFEGAGYDGTVVLPPYTRVIIDEAHTIEDSATSFFSKSFSRLAIYRQLGRLLRRRGGRRLGLLPKIAVFGKSGDANADSTDSTDNISLVEKAEEIIEKTRAAIDELDEEAISLCGKEGTFRLKPGDEDYIKNSLSPKLIRLRQELRALSGLITEKVESIEAKIDDKSLDESVVGSLLWETRVIIRRLDTIAQVCSSFLEYSEHSDEVMYLEKVNPKGMRGGSSPWVVFTASPVNTAPVLADALFKPNKTVICTSATLTVNGLFDYWLKRCGLELADERNIYKGSFPSPFPYKTATLLAVPSDAPLPDAADYRDFVDGSVPRLVETAGGSALVLFTSYTALNSSYEKARPLLEEVGIACLKQGDDERSRLLKRFLEDKTSCLFATDSFWEGIDAPGDTLTLVILCRLPFRSPSEPVFEARSEAIEREGGSSFMELSLPEAVMKFKQGFGRLMRRSSDRGVVVALDGRLLRKGYGQLFLKSVPETKTCFGSLDQILREAERFLF